MTRLVARLETLDEDVAVVFDGRERDVGAERVAVTFAGGGRDAADAEIARRVLADPDPAGLAVVTSDRALAERVAAAGAEVSARGRAARGWTATTWGRRSSCPSS